MCVFKYIMCMYLEYSRYNCSKKMHGMENFTMYSVVFDSIFIVFQ